MVAPILGCSNFFAHFPCQVRIVVNSGIHPGIVLEDWLHKKLAENGAGTLGELKSKCDLGRITFEKVPSSTRISTLSVRGHTSELQEPLSLLT